MDEAKKEKLLAHMLEGMKKHNQELSDLLQDAKPDDLKWMMEVCQAAKFWHNLYNMILGGVLEIVGSHAKDEKPDLDKVMAAAEESLFKTKLKEELGMDHEPVVLKCDGSDLLEIVCPCCQVKQKAAASAPKEAARKGRPTPGSPSVCGGCGALLIFNDDLTVREPELNDLLAISPELMATLEDWQRKVKQSKNNQD